MLVNHILESLSKTPPAAVSWWPMVSALVASVGVTAAGVYYARVLALTRLTNSAKMVMDLNKEFNSPEMRVHRREFAATLLDKRPLNLRNDAPVLEFFEEVGYMTRRKVLDAGMVWNSFTWCLEPYFLTSKAAIEDVRKDTHRPGFFSETEWLHKKMTELDRKYENQKYMERSKEDLKEFLTQERTP